MSRDTLVSVRRLNVVDNSTASIVQIGDREHTCLYNQAITIKRDKTIYGTDEPYFESYPLFYSAVPALDWMLPKGKVEHCMLGKLVPLPQQTHTIEVDSINIISNSDASNIQIGNGGKLAIVNREKSFKQYLSGEEEVQKARL